MFLKKCFNNRQTQDNIQDEAQEKNGEELQLMKIRSYAADDDVQIQIEEDDEDESNSDENNKKSTKSKFKVYWNRYESFIHSPKVHFFYDTFFYCVFLLLFSYLLLCDYSYYHTYEEMQVSDTDNITNQNATNVEDYSIRQKIIKNPSIFEYIIAFWVFSFLVDELYQVKNSL